MQNIFYNTNGIPSSDAPLTDFWVQETKIDYILKEGDHTLDIEAACIRLRERLIVKIFGSLANYYALMPQSSMAYVYGGIDAEVNVSKEEFEKFAVSRTTNPLHNKLLYFFDAANLISTLQNAIVESKYLLGEFYRILNRNSFLVDAGVVVVPDGLQYASGMIVTNITSTVNHLFINLYSQLDFLTKITYELENLPSDFTAYPKLKSKDILFGGSSRTSLNGLRGSIYEPTDDIHYIMTLRNEVVHNSSIDSIPKVYQKMAASQIVEKFILLPDMENGHIKAFKNRKRFFSQEKKLNILLPLLVTGFWKRVLFTIKAIQ